MRRTPAPQPEPRRVGRPAEAPAAHEQAGRRSARDEDLRIVLATNPHRPATVPGTNRPGLPLPCDQRSPRRGRTPGSGCVPRNNTPAHPHVPNATYEPREHGDVIVAAFIHVRTGSCSSHKFSSPRAGGDTQLTRPRDTVVFQTRQAMRPGTVPDEAPNSTQGPGRTSARHTTRPSAHTPTPTRSTGRDPLSSQPGPTHPAFGSARRDATRTPRPDPESRHTALAEHATPTHDHSARENPAALAPCTESPFGLVIRPCRGCRFLGRRTDRFPRTTAWRRPPTHAPDATSDTSQERSPATQALVVPGRSLRIVDTVARDPERTACFACVTGGSHGTEMVRDGRAIRDDDLHDGGINRMRFPRNSPHYRPLDSNDRSRTNSSSRCGYAGCGRYENFVTPNNTNTNVDRHPRSCFHRSERAQESSRMYSLLARRVSVHRC